MLDRSKVRVLAAIIGMISVVGLVFGLTGPLLNLLLVDRGYSNTLIGINGAMMALGGICVTPFIPRLVVWAGPMRLIFTGLISAAILLLGMRLFEAIEVWFVLRFLLGAAIVIPFVLSEVWINQIASDGNRGRLLGVYAACISLGFGAGPLLVSFTGTQGWLPFLVAAGLVSLGCLVILGAGKSRPEFESNHPTPIFRYFKLSPVALMAGVVYGAVESGVFQLLPVFGTYTGLENEASARLLTVIALGNVVLQFPVGWLADRIKPIRVLIGCATIGAIGGLALPVLMGTLYIWPLLFIWGGTITGVYTIGLTMLGHRYKGLQLAGANAALIAAYNFGSLTGSPFLGQSMDLVLPDGFGYGLAMIFGAFLLFALFMRGRAQPAPEAA
ncbi:MAG: MFS transporter [Alphaproteobacteria bacterium]